MVKTDIKILDNQYEQYLRDESRTLGHASSISFPTSEAEVVSTVIEIAADGTPITVQGGRTGLAAGAIPDSGHIMNLSKMNRIKGMKSDASQHRFFLMVEPGVVLSELNKQIQSRNFNTEDWSEISKSAFTFFCESEEYFFKPDPTETSATIGGMAACNASGARSYAYGATRKHVYGIRVVLSSGDILVLNRGDFKAKDGRLNLMTENGNEINLYLPDYRMPNTKNASGYYVYPDMDAVDLFIGSDGTLGIITELTLELSPLPKNIWGVTCFFQEELDCINFVNVIRELVDKVVSMEYFDHGALQILRQQRRANPAFVRLPEIDAQMNTACYLEIHADDEKVCFETLQTVKHTLDMISKGKQTKSWVARTDADRALLLFFRHAVPESVNMLIDERKKIDARITKLGTDMSVPDSALDTVYKMYREGLEKYALESAIWGHIGNNHLHVNILPNNIDEYNKGKALYKEWAAAVTDLGGAVSAEHGVGKLKRDFLTVMYGEDNIEQMRHLKLALDPLSVFGRGNLFAYLSPKDR